MCTLEASPRMSVSSVYWMQWMLPDVCGGPIPTMRSLDAAVRKIRATTSKARMKRRGERGSPCLRPLLACIQLSGSPLTIGAALLIWRMALIQEHHLDPNPLCLRSVRRKSYLMLSNAFSKSIFRSRPFCFDFF